MSEESKLPVITLTRKDDGKVITLNELIEVCREGKTEDEKVYTYRHSEDQEKPTAWVWGSELKLWAYPDEKLQKAMEQLSHYEGEKRWRRAVLDSIEPGMTEARAQELKIVQQIKLLDEQYQITMDGVPVGEPYPMPPGMIEAIMWGPKKPKKDI